MHCWLNKSHNICLSLHIANRIPYMILKEVPVARWGMRKKMPFRCIDLRVPPSCRTEWNKLTCQTFTSFPRCCRRHKQLREEDWSCRSVPYRWCARSVDGPDISARRALTAELTAVANNQIYLFRCNDGAIARADTLIFYEFTHSFFFWKYHFFW